MMAVNSNVLVSATFVMTLIVIIFNVDPAMANDSPSREVLKCMGIHIIFVVII